MAEEGWTTNIVAKEAIHEYLQEFQGLSLDALILGCTHYPLFTELIKQELGENIEIINTGTTLAIKLQEELTKQNLLSNTKQANYQFYLTDVETNFIQVAKRLLPGDKCIEKILLADI